MCRRQHISQDKMLTGKNRKQNLDRHGNKEQIKPLDLKAVDPVMMQSQSGQWTSGFVRDLHPTKVAYVIQSKGRRYRRNRKFLRPPRVQSNSVSRDDVPAFTNVTLRSNTTQSTNINNSRYTAVPETTTSRSCQTTCRKTCVFSR